jgi:ADP-heptose:LPS heptosyltransferase
MDASARIGKVGMSVSSLREVLKNLLNTVTPNLWNNHQGTQDCPRVIALVNWDNLGDFVLFTAVIRETRTNYPDSKLIVVAQKENSEIVGECDLVDCWIWIKGHRKPKPGMGHGRETSYWTRLIKTYFILLFLGKRQVDLLIGPDWLLVNNPKQFTSNFLFAKGNRELKALKEATHRNTAQYLNHAHQVTRMLSVLRMFGLVTLSDEIENWMPSSAVTHQIYSGESMALGRPNILISLGAGQARRSWPHSYVDALVKKLVQIYPGIVITVIGPKSLISVETDELFTGSKNLVNLIGKTDLSNIVWLMKRADMLVSNDSGLIHIASSLKLPTVVVSSHPLNGDPWHLNSPNRYHPWKTRFVCLQPEKLLDDCFNSCRSKQAHCIKSITPDQVLSACSQLITGI